MKPDCIFISYSHKLRGPEWKHRLIAELAFFEKHGLIAAWDDEQIPAGARWEKEIADAIHNSRLAVILLTKEALESEFILQRELVPLQQREKDGVIVIPVNCGCEDKEYQHHDWIKTLQIRPFEAKPLSSIADEVQLLSVIRRLASEIAEELGRSALAQIPPATTEVAVVREYLDKFPLTRGSGQREEKLIGREQELALLDLAFSQPNTAIVSLVAWGGVGKTMLVQHWLQRLQRNGWFGARRVYAWSFYSQGTREDRQASEDMFLAHALEWFGVQCEPTLSPWDKGRLLADAVARERTLLILDGIEPLQYPPGPMGGQLRKVGDDESYLRAAGVQSLLKQLARKANAGEDCGLCLVTTRVWLADLSNFQRRDGSPWGSVLRVNLGNLTDEAGAALLHHAGAYRSGAAKIKPDDKELLAASREVDGHALTLNLLGRFLARAHVGDIRRRDLVRFEEADHKEQGGTTFKMLDAFEDWFSKGGEFGARQLAILRILSLFDRPASVDCIRALRKPPVISGLTDPLFTMRLDASTDQVTSIPLVEEEWNTATSFLVDFCLIVIQTETHNCDLFLDCHPLVREHFDRKLVRMQAAAFQQAQSRLFTHLFANTSYQPDTLSGLEPLYQAIAHGCRAGLHYQALRLVYQGRIMRKTDHRGNYANASLGAHSRSLTALAAFYQVPWHLPSTSLPDFDQGWLLNETALCLKSVGRLAEALDPMQAALSHSVRDNDWRNASVDLSHLCEIQVTLGLLGLAVRNGRSAVEFADRCGDIFRRVGLRAVSAHTLFQTGEAQEARELFVEAERLHAEHQDEYSMLVSLPGFFYSDLLLGVCERAAWKLFMTTFHRRCHPTLSLPQNTRQRHEANTTTKGGMMIASCVEAADRAKHTLPLHQRENHLRDIALDQLTIARSDLYRTLLLDAPDAEFSLPEMDSVIAALRRAQVIDYIPDAMLTAAFFSLAVCNNFEEAERYLDEALEIVERGPMRLHLADIYLHRARLFYREKSYPWESPQADLAAAETLINECAYHRRDEELADAKRAILGAA